MINRGNPMRRRSPAQIAARAAAAARASAHARHKSELPEPFGRMPSGSIAGGSVKTMPEDLRALIDAALARRTG